jgi:hypothetical protein
MNRQKFPMEDTRNVFMDKRPLNEQGVRWSEDQARGERDGGAAMA